MRILALFLIAFPALAQSPAFEAATIRPAAANALRPAAASSPDRLTFHSTTLKGMLIRAFDLKFGAQVEGPAWISTERFDLNAKAPDHTPADQLLKMLQTLLIERFQLELHHETREFPSYALVAGKGRLKLDQGSSDGVRDTYDFPNGQRAARNMSMAALARYVSMTVGTPVVDQTGLSGRFNFPYEISSEELGGKPDHPSIFTIVEELGLKLESKKLPFDVVMVDRGNKVPIEN